MRTCPGASPSGEERSVSAREEEEEEEEEALEKREVDKDENVDAFVPSKQRVASFAVAPASSRKEGDLPVPVARCTRQRSISSSAWGRKRFQRFMQASMI